MRPDLIYRVRKMCIRDRISTASADFIFPSAPRAGFRRDERLKAKGIARPLACGR